MPLQPANLLAQETSPYLLQHKDNPVHWRAWSPQALEEAATQDRPILLSVGYAACHWCHVMAHESFEDQSVAEVMNRLFVNIKVDREERPDIDQIYMAALTATGEQGGWPLTMFLTPQGKPFWGGTYFPKETRYGRPGFVQVLEAVHKAWTEKRSDLDSSADALTDHVRSRLAPRSTSAALSADHVKTLAAGIHNMVDLEKGGLRGAPKFPNAPFMKVLWLDWLQNGKDEHRDAVVVSMKKMLAGGIYDHVGGGLSRYSTDAEWLVPHFEKMLYDNAQLLQLASWAYATAGDELFRIRIEETAGWLLREMRLEGGGFASSLDADTAGEEGLFYLWERAEIEEVLGADAASFFETFSLASPDHWEGKPILHRLDHADYQSPEKEQRLRQSLDHLLERRVHRAKPGRDDKALVDWNGMTIAALAEAARLFDRADWVKAAVTAYRFVCESMQDGRLPHSILGNRRHFPALLSDYAAMINAAISLFGASGDGKYLDQAGEWLSAMKAWHADESGTGFYLTASDCNDIPFRLRGDVDEAVPSATSQAIEAMARYGAVTGDYELAAQASDTAEAALGRALGQHYGQAGIVFACGLAMQPMKLVLFDPNGAEGLVSLANRFPDPRRVDLVAGDGSQDLASLLPPGAKSEASRATAWLCIGPTCLPPLHDAAELDTVLRKPMPVS